MSTIAVSVPSAPARAARLAAPDSLSVALFLVLVFGVFAPALACALPLALNTQRLQRFAEAGAELPVPAGTRVLTRTVVLEPGGGGVCRAVVRITVVSPLARPALEAYYAARGVSGLEQAQVPVRVLAPALDSADTRDATGRVGGDALVVAERPDEWLVTLEVSDTMRDAHPFGWDRRCHA